MSEEDMLTELDDLFAEDPEVAIARKRYSARLGHIKRRVHQGERIEGKLLDLALQVIPGGGADDPDDLKAIHRKLIEGESLNGYEQHLVIDMFLLHARLAGP